MLQRFQKAIARFACTVGFLVWTSTLGCAGGVPHAMQGSWPFADDSDAEQRARAARQQESRDSQARAQDWLEHSRRGRKFLAVGDITLAEVEFLAALEASEGMQTHDARAKAALANVERLADQYAQRGNHAGTFRISPPLIEAVKRQRGPEDSALSLTWTRLANARVAEKELDAAAEALSRALELQRAGFGHPDADFGVVAGGLAKAYQEQGDVGVAESLYLQALEAADTRGVEDLELVRTLNQLTWFYAGLDRHEDAEPPARRAVDITETSSELSPQVAATTLDTLAQVLTELGRLTEADEIYARAGPKSKGTPIEGAILLNHAEVLSRLGKHTAATKLRNLANGIPEPGAEQPTQTNDLADPGLLSEAESAQESEQ